MVLQANRMLIDDYRNPYAIGQDLVQENEEIVNNVNHFITHKDSLGYNVFAIDLFKNQQTQMMETNTNDTSYRYKVSYFYTYTEKEKERLSKQINDKPKYDYSFYTQPKNEQLDQLDSLQFLKVILSEKELMNNKLERKAFASLFVPEINDVENGIFYFSCYNKTIDSITFREKIPFFKSMFLKDLSEKYKAKTRKFKIENTEILNEN